MRRWMSGVTKTQFQCMARLIAESKIPLKYSWCDEELLDDVFLATGVKSPDLKNILYASFDGANKKWWKGGRQPIIHYLYLLLDVDNIYFCIRKERDKERGKGKFTYFLEYAEGMDMWSNKARTSNAVSLDDAVKKYRETIEQYCCKGASKDIVYSGK